MMCDLMMYRYVSVYCASGVSRPSGWRVQMRVDGRCFCRVLAFARYGGREESLAWAVRLRDRVLEALELGGDPAWVFYVYGGAPRPKCRPCGTVI